MTPRVGIVIQLLTASAPLDVIETRPAHLDLTIHDRFTIVVPAQAGTHTTNICGGKQSRPSPADADEVARVEPCRGAEMSDVQRT